MKGISSVIDPRLSRYFAKYRGRYILGGALLIAASLVTMLPPAIIARVIDGLGEGTTTSQLATYGGMIIAIAALESVLRLSSRMIISGTSRKVEYELRNEMAARLLQLDQHYYVRAHTGDLMARCTNDLQRVRDLAGPATVEIGRAVTMMVIGFGFMMWLDVKLALIAVAYFPIVIFVMIRFRARVEDRYRDVQDQFGEISNRVQESISGIRAVKAYAQELSELEKFSKDNRELMRRTMSWAMYMGAFWPFMIFIGNFSLALILWFGGQDVVGGRLTLGEFVQFTTYLTILSGPLIGLGWTLSMAQQGLASMKRVAEVLSAEPQLVESQTPVTLDAPRGDIEFRDVHFSYYDEPVLRGIDLKIPAGKTVALVGGTGAGKTTLVNLLVRLYDPTQGHVYIDGVDVRDQPIAQVRELVGFVPQETFLFSESLRENVALARDDAPEADVDYAVENSRLSSDLPQLTHGLDTVLGERGVTLSGGQKQRTALARALLKAPPIVVLDDALSHVDTHTEEEILTRVRDFMAERTTILIAHRTSTILAADSIVVLEHGRIAEQGTHQELLAHDGVYARFYRRQLLAEQVEGEPVPADSTGGAS
jgi:ATP-binding cassette subfamily B multidrug efflux pump